MSLPATPHLTPETNPANGASLTGTPPGTIPGSPPGPVARHPTAPSASMDDILNNMMKNIPDPSQIIIPPKQQAAPLTPPAPETPPAPPVSPGDGFTPEVPEVAPEAPPVQPQGVLPDDGSDPVLESKPGFKNLRENHKKLKTEHEALQARLKEIETERDEYKTGKRAPETLADQEAEIQRLRQIERAHSIKTHPEYLEKQKPLRELEGKLTAIFTGYDIPAEEVKAELEELRGMTSEKEQNAFLEERFTPLAALEVKNLLRQEASIRGELRTLEQDAEKGLLTLNQQAAQAEAVRKNQQKEKIQGWVRQSWAEVNQEIRSEGHFRGLIPQAGESEWNTKVVQPTLNAAAAEAGRIIKSIHEEGLTAENVKAIQKMVMLSHHAGITEHQLNSSINHIKSQEQQSLNDRNIFRPRVGQGSPSVGAPSQKKERMTPESAGERSLAGIPGR